MLRLGSPSRAVPTESKNNAACGIGLRVTRHPRMGAVEEPEVPLREPSSNERLRQKAARAGSCAATLKFLSGNHHKTKALERSWPNTLRSVVRQGSALRSDRCAPTAARRAEGRAALTDASAAGVAGHEEHVCSSVLKRTGVRLRSHRAAWAGPAAGGAR